LSASKIGDLLIRLTDIIRSNKLAEAQFGSNNFWSRFKRTFESLSKSFADFGAKITVKIKAGPIEAIFGKNN
jgi:hypothetical protein